MVRRDALAGRPWRNPRRPIPFPPPRRATPANAPFIGVNLHQVIPADPFATVTGKPASALGVALPILTQLGAKTSPSDTSAGTPGNGM